MPKTTTAPAATRLQVIGYMRACVRSGEHVDYDEVNCTTLAEDACQHFNAYGPAPRFDCPEDFFEWSFEVHQWYEGGMR